MAEALKTFGEGEDILASETNENNQYLLSKLSDNAAQVQSYVEGEVATIKSNVASAQATLQNNIDEVRELLKQVYINMQPDWNNKVIKSIGQEHTANKNGFVVYGTAFIGSYTANASLYINGKKIAYSGWDKAALSVPFGPFPVSKGDTFKVDGNANGELYFVPCKGEFPVEE